MSGVRVLVGTRKGAFILTGDGKRKQWNVSGPHFAGWEIYHLKGSPADPNRLYASQTSGWFGQIIQRSCDGGKTWETPGGVLEKTPEGFPKGESNKFVYDTSPETGKPLTTHQWYDGTQHPWEFKRVWHLEPSLTDPDTVYAGVEDAGLFRTSDGGKTWQEFAGLRGHGTGPKWQPGAGGMCLHTVLLDPSNPRRMYVAISAAGAFRTDDGGNTWKPINRGLHSQYIPDPNAEIGHCVHRIALHRSRPNVLFMQKHWDVMRSDDAGDSWREVSGNLPTDFGFVIDVHAHEPETIYVVPIKSDSEHYVPDGKLRVYRSRSGGTEWEPLTKGLPQRDCYVNVLRDAMAVDSLEPCGVYFGTTGGYTRRPTPATAGRPSSATFPPCCPSRFSGCHDPRGAPAAPADAGPGQRRGAARRSGTGHSGRGARRARGPLSHAPRDDPRPRHRAATAVPAIFCVRAGPDPRPAGCPASRRGRVGDRAFSRRRGHRRRVAWRERRYTSVRYMLLIYLDEQALDEAEREQCYRESAQLAHELSAAGQYLAAAPLEPTAAATSVRVRKGKRVVTDGPFAETKEQLGGYFLIDASDLDEAIAIAARIPMASRGTIEVRPVVHIPDLPAD